MLSTIPSIRRFSSPSTLGEAYLSKQKEITNIQQQLHSRKEAIKQYGEDILPLVLIRTTTGEELPKIPMTTSLLKAQKAIFKEEGFTDIVKNIHDLGVSILSEEEIFELCSTDPVAKGICDPSNPIKLVDRIRISGYQYYQSTLLLESQLDKLVAQQKEIEKKIHQEVSLASTQPPSGMSTDVSDDDDYAFV